MIFVDTSIWVEFFRNRAHSASVELQRLLDEDLVSLAAPVRLEILSGASSRDFHRLRRVLSALPLFYPSADTWALLDLWLETAVAQGQRFGVGDLLVAAIATEGGGQLWSNDSDFSRMERLRFVKRYAP